ncbi:hypothetical protein D3C85_418530 [compost metagenome]
MTMGVAMTTDDPWKELTAPTASAAINGKRVNAELPWDFFWARGTDRRHLLVLHHQQSASPNVKLPTLRGIETVITDADPDGRRSLILKLLDSAQRDLFYTLCLDIIATAGQAPTEAEAVNLSLTRTWRWHHMLRGGGDGRLSPEEQKGLAGEMVVLETLLLPRLSPYDAVMAWRGPLGSPKDFEIGGVCIEAKARRGAAKPYVAISSEYQLDATGSDVLFLHVANVDTAIVESADAFTLPEMARRVHSTIASGDMLAADLFERLIIASGLDWDADYSSDRMQIGTTAFYRVNAGFPAITPAVLSAGVRDVRYVIALPDCAAYLVTEQALDMALAGDAGAS